MVQALLLAGAMAATRSPSGWCREVLCLALAGDSWRLSLPSTQGTEELSNSIRTGSLSHQQGAEIGPGAEPLG